jgi:hypothetical protein
MKSNAQDGRGSNQPASWGATNFKTQDINDHDDFTRNND